MTKLLIKSDFKRYDDWRNAFARVYPELELNFWPDVPQPDAVDFALLWQPPAGWHKPYKNLKAIFSVGAGVDHLSGKDLLPAGVPVVRMVDRALTSGMIEYVVFNTLRFHRNMHEYAQDQMHRVWSARVYKSADRVSVGILGLGTLGQACAQSLHALGFKVVGWSRNRKTVEGVRSFAGDMELGEFLQQTNILVCLLPLTDATRGILNHNTLSQLPAGAFVINAGRGDQLVEDDLISLLNSGHVAAAALDVFTQEPLPTGDAFWGMPQVHITPHIASMTQPASSAEHVANNIKRYLNGEPFTHLVDMSVGY